MKQHAFIIQVHKQPQLLGRILQILNSPNHHFFIHVDAKVKRMQDFLKAVRHIGNVHFLMPRRDVQHAGKSQFYCTLALLQHVKQVLPEYDYVHTLSGQDYPLRSNKQFDDFFEHTDYSFMLYDSEERHAKWVDTKYKQRVCQWYPDNQHTFFTRVYCHSGMMKLISSLFPRPVVPEIRGGGVGLVGHQVSPIMCFPM